LIAPAAPHLAEELYQNLLHRIDENTPVSVHLAGWPDCDKSLIDEDLNRKMTAVLRAAEAGESARTKAGIRASQPLPEIYLVVNSTDEAQDIKPFLYLLAEALNTCQIDVAAEVGDRISILLRLIPERLEARHPDLYPAVRDALILMEPEPAARQLLAGKPLELTLDGQHLFIQPEEVEIVVEAPSGMELIGIDDMLFILNTNLSQELIEEGYAQELIQRINRLRDQAEIKPDFPIHLRYESSAGLARAIHSHRKKILADTNAITLDPGLPATGGTSVEIKIDDEKATLVLESASEHSE
jgi:isoleucyl-tRNA synthetase